MTQHKDRKAKIRARMAATGEPYSVAARKLPSTAVPDVIRRTWPDIHPDSWEWGSPVHWRAPHPNVPGAACLVTVNLAGDQALGRMVAGNADEAGVYADLDRALQDSMDRRDACEAGTPYLTKGDKCVWCGRHLSDHTVTCANPHCGYAQPAGAGQCASRGEPLPEAVAAPAPMRPEDLGDPLLDDDLIRNGLWDREGDGEDLVLGDAENWDYQEVEDAWTIHATAQLREHGIVWDTDTDEVTLPPGMATEDAAAVWQEVGDGFGAWIGVVIAQTRTGKALAPADDTRPSGAPGARWITHADPYDPPVYGDDP